ncbi:MAG: hypothetical protein Q8P41_25570 [Pseudomonadota bacterium]|nr:hypothetical protein [Pseudomonadota bacterium]
MNNPIKVDPNLLPTLQELYRATVGALIVASILLVTAVLPAEAGIDPTGIGGVLGLTALGELKRDGAAPPTAKAAPQPVVATATVAAPVAAPPAAAYAFRSDEMTLTLRPSEGLEVKATMRAGDQMVYSWTADKGELFFDFHGDPKGAAADVFTSYEKGSKSAAQGEFEASFEGVHGWYWKNRTSETISLQLKTSGIYEKIARK